jgi:hypothetical protein
MKSSTRYFDTAGRINMSGWFSLLAMIDCIIRRRTSGQRSSDICAAALAGAPTTSTGDDGLDEVERHRLADAAVDQPAALRSKPLRPASAKRAVGAGLQVGVDVVDVRSDIGVVGEALHD